ncbi:MAG TPA: type I methionyl aminopeptidase [Victivallales bacterium]|nr:type I methionyl aminopeptidase [Victivallales bacterium]
MSIIIKNKNEIEMMRQAGKLAADVLVMIAPYVKEGISTGDLNLLCHNYIVFNQGAVPSPLNYNGFPASICTSVNDVVCHGIPDFKQVLIEGDIVNLDITVNKNGFHGDTSMTFIIGSAKQEAVKLVETTKQCLYEAIKIVKPGIRLGEIGYTIQKLAESQNYSVVRDYCGHGIGREFHEPPCVAHYGNKHKGVILKEGMTFTVEPMINLGDFRVVTSKRDNWTVTSRDNKLSAQFEHTLLVTKNGCEVLTKRHNEIMI